MVYAYNHHLVYVEPQPITAEPEGSEAADMKKMDLAKLDENGVKIVTRKIYRHELDHIVFGLTDGGVADHSKTWPAIFEYALPRGIGLVVKRARDLPGYTNRVVMLNTETPEPKVWTIDVSDLKKLGPKDFHLERYEKYDPTMIVKLFRRMSMRTGFCLRCSQASLLSMRDLVMYGVGFSRNTEGGRRMSEYLPLTLPDSGTPEWRWLEENGTVDRLMSYGSDAILGLCQGCVNIHCTFCETRAVTNGMTMYQIVRARGEFCGACAPKKYTDAIERPTKRPVFINLDRVM